MVERVIKVENLNKDFVEWKYFQPRRKNILKDVSFEVCKGEAVAFLGPNGAGKTTTINILLGHLFFRTGKVEVLNKLPGDSSIFPSLGYLSEVFYTYEYTTAEKILRFYGEMLGLDKSYLDEAIPSKLELVSLSDKSDSKVSGFSKGMKQRLGLAQALLHNPSLLILDEPMTGLDPEGRNLFVSIILEQKKKGTTIFFSSHILSDVQKICDCAILIKEGRVVSTNKFNSKKLEDVWLIKIDANESQVEKVTNIVSSEVITKIGDFYNLECSGEEKKQLVKSLATADIDIVEIMAKDNEQSLEEVYLDIIKEE